MTLGRGLKTNSYRTMAAFEEITDVDADLHSGLRRRRDVVVSRPAYTEQSFQEQHTENIKEQVTLLTRLRRKAGKCSCTPSTVKKFFFSVIPILSWLPKYEIKSTLPRDLISGFTVGIFRIPHGMAHAILADVSPIYGLYTSFFPPLVYSIFGTSRQLSIGTFAVVSIMSGQAIDKVMEVIRQDRSEAPTKTITIPSVSSYTVGSEAAFNSSIGGDFPSSGGGVEGSTALFASGEEALLRAQIGALLALMVGVIQVSMSILRLGFVTCYLADPLVRGFTTGAAFHVFTSQFNKLFGVPVPRHSGILSLPKTYRDFFQNIHLTNVSAMINSMLGIFFLVIVKELQDKFKDKIKFPLPIELAVIIASTAASYAGDFTSQFGMPIVGEISSSAFSAPSIPPFGYMSILIADAFVIAIVAFSVSVSLSVIFAKRNKYEVSANQELLGYGTSNIFSSFFLCYPCSGSLSRSLLQDLGGGKTQIAGIVSVFPILLVLFLLTQFFQSLPVGCLAAIVVVALRGMFRQVKDLRDLWKFSKVDCMLWLVTCLAVILLGVDIGLGVGVAVAIFSVILRTQRPKCGIMGHIPNTDIYRDLSYYRAAEELPGLKIFRVNAPIYFANAEYIKESMYSITGVHPQKILQERAKKEKELAKAQVKYTKTSSVEEIQNGEIAIESHEMQPETHPGHNNGNNHEITTANAELLEAGTSSSRSMDESSEEEVDPTLVKTIILDFGAVSFVDAMGLSTLKVIVADYEKVQVDIIMANCRGPIRALLFKSGFLDLIGLDKIYITLHDAVLQNVDNEHHLLASPACRLVSDPGAVVKYHLAANEEPDRQLAETIDANI
ncbi:pendrin isoform X3 [Strongylocentrotus purpuratus]|uniref:STAS domain-containing protein n=1 Tax=Strongylocentrotus purpuratus TaxID=7668 RepID=A0A7M7RFE8_STRPU|nr:pendrin isoform X3 [Strongylocentrotus purpuratus]